MPSVISDSEKRMRQRVADSKARNPNDENCTTCFKFGKFCQPNGCECVNPEYWCEKHSKNK